MNALGSLLFGVLSFLGRYWIIVLYGLIAGIIYFSLILFKMEFKGETK